MRFALGCFGGRANYVFPRAEVYHSAFRSGQGHLQLHVHLSTRILYLRISKLLIFRACCGGCRIIYQQSTATSKSFWSRSAHVFAVGSVALVGGKLEFLKYPNCLPVFALQYEFSVLTFPIFRIEEDSGFRVFPLDPVLFSNLLKNHILKFVHRQCSRMCSRDFSVVSVLFRRSASDSHLFRYRR